MRRICDYSPQEFKLLLHQKTGRGLLHELCYAHSRSVRPMRRAERVINVNVAERSELARKFLVIVFFFRVKAEVLEQQHIAVVHAHTHFPYVFAHTIIGEIN